MWMPAGFLSKQYIEYIYINRSFIEIQLLKILVGISLDFNFIMIDFIIIIIKRRRCISPPWLFHPGCWVLMSLLCSNQHSFPVFPVCMILWVWLMCSIWVRDYISIHSNKKRWQELCRLIVSIHTCMIMTHYLQTDNFVSKDCFRQKLGIILCASRINVEQMADDGHLSI